jgi:NAD(P)H-dependent nitrite reductase small subunit
MADTTAQFTRVAGTGDIPPGTGKVVQAGGKTVAVFNCDGTFYAIDNTCKHRGGPLGEGSVSGTTVTCPWHGWEYDVRSGSCGFDPSIKVQAFPVKVQGEDILVAV